MNNKETIDKICEIKSQINFNKTYFGIYHELVNKYLSELDRINTEDRELYKELDELTKSLEGVELWKH